MRLRRRKGSAVQIVGASPSLREAPVIPGAERWLFNASYLADGGRPYTRVFNLHDRAMILALQPQAWAWYAQQDRPVYLLNPHPDIPTSVAFPLTRLQTRFAANHHNAGLEDEDCFGCTVDFLIAFALDLGFDHIDLAGIEARSEEEYTEQRASIQYWMGWARGLGRTLTVSRSSGLGSVPAIYGYNLVTGSPCPPGRAREWRTGHPHSTWPVIPVTGALINGAYEHP